MEWPRQWNSIMRIATVMEGRIAAIFAADMVGLSRPDAHTQTALRRKKKKHPKLLCLGRFIWLRGLATNFIYFSLCAV